MAAGSARPATGSVVARARGWRGPLPPFMVIGGRLHQGKRAIIGEGAGPLGAQYDPFRLEYEAGEGFRFPALQLPAHLTPERLTDRRNLLRTFDRVRFEVESSGRGLDTYRDQAIAMLTSPRAARMFDLAQERPAMID